MTTVRNKENRFRTDEKRQRNKNHMASVRETESEKETHCKNHFLNEDTGRRRSLFHGPDFCSEDYLNIEKMYTDCAHCSAPHFID